MYSGCVRICKYLTFNCVYMIIRETDILIGCRIDQQQILCDVIINRYIHYNAI